MALSMSALGRRGSLVPDGAGGWKLQLSTKFKWDIEKFKKREGEARMKALSRAGLITKRLSQKQFRRRQIMRKPIWTNEGTHNGYPLVAIRFQDSTQGRVTTWKPKEFLRRDIEDDYDPKTRSVVIGPSKFPRLNQLHEFGGRDEVKLKLVRDVPVTNLYQYKVPQSLIGKGQGRDRRGRFMRKGAYVGTWHSSRARVKGKRRTVAYDSGKVPKAGYMAKGIAAAKGKIPQQFRNQLRGP